MNKIVTQLAGLATLSAFGLASCTRVDLSYFTDVDANAQYAISQSYNHKIQKADKLMIKISSKSPELVLPFTQAGSPSTSATIQNPDDLNATATSTAQTAGDAYIVNAQGNIIFPILGNINAQGLTYQQLEKAIEKKLIDGGYIADPSVTVNLGNFKITVLGEVDEPGVHSVDSDRVSVFDALALSGDMTQYGVRENVSLIRENNQKRQIVSLDLSSKEIFDSPYYYLQPNDTLYVKPNNAKAWNSTTNSVIVTYTLAGFAALFSLFNLLDD